MRTTKAAVTIALSIAAANVSANTGCESWGRFGEISASMRDQGTSEDRALKLIGSSIDDDQTLMVLSTVNHRIYTEPALRAMSPKRVGRALQALCESN